MPERLYLDHAATTPMLPQARAAVAEGMARWANPSSPHAEGRAARAALEAARAEIADALGWAGAVILTSGASEAIQLAIGRTTRTGIAMSAVEHDAVRRAAPDATVLPVDRQGIVVIEGVAPGTLVAVQQVNSETGVIQPLDLVAAAVRAGGGVLLADCAQSAGKLALPDADLIAVSAHKLGGPPGIGALLVRDLALLLPTGGQELGYRPGTENLPGALGFAAALQARGPRVALEGLRAWLDRAMAGAGAEVVAEASPRIAEIASYRMPCVKAVTQLIRFDAGGIAVSAGSACSSGSLKPGHVLPAMGWDEAAAGEAVRVSFGLGTTAADVERVMEAWTEIAGSGRQGR